MDTLRIARLLPDARTVGGQLRRRIRSSTTAIGNPTTFEYEPSIRGMNRDASP